MRSQRLLSTPCLDELSMTCDIALGVFSLYAYHHHTPITQLWQKAEDNSHPLKKVDIIEKKSPCLLALMWKQQNKPGLFFQVTAFFVQYYQPQWHLILCCLFQLNTLENFTSGKFLFCFFKVLCYKCTIWYSTQMQSGYGRGEVEGVLRSVVHVIDIVLTVSVTDNSGPSISDILSCFAFLVMCLFVSFSSIT